MKQWILNIIHIHVSMNQDAEVLGLYDRVHRFDSIALYAV